MNYQSYITARDESLSFLIKHQIIELPINLTPILNSMNIVVRKDYNLPLYERGYSVFEDNAFQKLSEDERNLFEKYKQLNSTNKAKILERIDTLLEIEKDNDN